MFKNNRPQGFCSISLESKNKLYIPFIDVSANALKSYDGYFNHPANLLYEIKWIDENQNRYNAEADIRKLLPRNFRGHIYFEIDKESNLTYRASNEFKGENIFKKTVPGNKLEEPQQ